MNIFVLIKIFLLPSIQTVKNYYTHNPYSEVRFRFDESKIYLDSIQCQYIFLSEDCFAIIQRIEYDSNLNTFNGFVTPVYIWCTTCKLFCM